MLCAIVFFTACKEEKKGKRGYVPDSVGAINSLAVVIDNELWNGEVGDEIRDFYAAPVDGLPSIEPLFTLHQIPPSVFSGTTTRSRNILLIQNDSAAYSGLKTDVHARPQQVGVIQASDHQTLIDLIGKTHDEYIHAFKENDVKANQKRFLISPNKENYLEQKFGITLKMPSVYKTGTQKDNFIWMERVIPKGTMHILVYQLPLDAIPDNDSDRVDAFIKMHDSIGKEYVPGREEGMYMVTQKDYAPYVFDITVAGKPTMETKGIWEMKNFSMAGPFVNYIIRDEANNRLLVLEGLTFAPSEDKRDYMFELESILKSVTFTGGHETTPGTK
ncbi:DUF4837 domain-containing protein [Sinomicrobium soli]|nr:DUF4837 domain-containing protein [Sinomicrobium sp. N-1-3-6]